MMEIVLCLAMFAAQVETIDGQTLDQAADEGMTGAPPGADLPEDAQGIGDPFPSGLNLEWLGSLSDNLRFTIDLSGRFEYATDTREWSITQMYGFDLFKVLSDEHGDYATIVMQGFATRINNNPSPPWFFDGPTDWEFIYRMFHINWKIAPRGVMNVKLGHFEMPFGLETLIDTNGTLRQMGTARNLGLKADWGMTLNGVVQGMQYEFGLGRGGGQQWQSAGTPYDFVGRVGTDPAKGWWMGVSGFSGELYRPVGNIARRRVGFDSGVEWGNWTLMGEVSGGNNGAADAIQFLGDLSWRDPDLDWFLYGQLQINKQRGDAVGWSGTTQTNLGVDWTPDRHWTLSAQWVQNLEPAANGQRDAMIRFQARYRF